MPTATAITVFNHERFVRGTNIQEIFAQLDVREPTHAFYLGKELARASLAMTLGKTYRQEGALSWGYLTPPDDAKSEHVQLDAARHAAAPGARARGRLTIVTPVVEELRARAGPGAVLRAARRAAVSAVPRQRRARRAAGTLFVT